MNNDKEDLIESSDTVEIIETNVTSECGASQKTDILFGASTYQDQHPNKKSKYLQLFLIIFISILLLYLILSNKYDLDSVINDTEDAIFFIQTLKTSISQDNVFNSNQSDTLDNVLFVHDGHCASGWVPPSTSQPSITDCLNECINRGRNVGYIAFRNGTRNTDCACYELSSGCPDDNLWPEHNAYMIVRKEFSLEALVGKWHHNRGATVTCTRISNTQINCQLVGSINGLREIIWDGSKYTYAGVVMDAPTIKLNSFGDREIDWDNGNKWSEFGGCKCKDLVNRNRVGNCQGRKPSQFNGQHFTCYVHLPSNCSDLKSSTTNPGEKFSAEACFKKVSSVSCGRHTASSCSDCPQGRGSSWCHGDCRWENSKCISKGSHVSCGNHQAASCTECPQGHGSSWCNGDCRWISSSSSCVNK